MPASGTSRAAWNSIRCEAPPHAINSIPRSLMPFRGLTRFESCQWSQHLSSSPLPLEHSIPSTLRLWITCHMLVMPMGCAAGCLVQEVARSHHGQWGACGPAGTPRAGPPAVPRRRGEGPPGGPPGRPAGPRQPPAVRPSPPARHTSTRVTAAVTRLCGRDLRWRLQHDLLCPGAYSLHV